MDPPIKFKDGAPIEQMYHPYLFLNSSFLLVVDF